MDLCFGLLILLVVLLILAAVGHGLWIGTAALFRALFGSARESESPQRRFETCPGCENLHLATAHRCPSCGLQLTGARAAELRDLAATLRQLRRLHRAGRLDEPTFDQLMQECRVAREELVWGGPAPQPSALSEEEIPEVLPALPARPAVPHPPRRIARERPTPVEVPAPVTAALPSPESIEPAPPLEPPPPPRPRRTFGQLLAGFMEEKNILWGEIVGGLLIVGCSVALVISLWSTLQQVPYFPFLIFAAITAALIGAGHYTLHHWKLDSTSRGLLVIGLLLVPLNFVVLTGLAGREASGPLHLAVQAVAVLGLTGLSTVAARVLAPTRPWLLALALVVPSVVQLFVPAVATSAAGALLLAGVASAFTLGSSGAALLSVARRPELEERSAREFLAFLGLTTFAVAATLSFIGSRCADIPHALASLSLPVAGVAVPLLAGGLFLFRERRAVLPGWLVTTASGVALLGVALLVVALALAWPLPGMVLAVGLIDFVLLTAVALRFRIAPVHVPALACLALAVLTAFHWAAGDLHAERPLHEALMGPSGGWALVVLAALAAAASELFLRRSRPDDGLTYAWGSGALAFLSLVLLATARPFAPGGLAIALAVHGVIAVLVNLRWQRTALFSTGQGLLSAAAVLAVVWGLAGRPWMDSPAGYFDPRSLQGYGIALTALSFVWVFLRPRVAPAVPRPALDELVFGVVVVGQLVVAAGCLLPDLLNELTPQGQPLAFTRDTWRAHALGVGAWALLAVTTVVQLVMARRRPDLAGFGLVLTATLAPVLAAAAFADQIAAATALRWLLAISFLLSSLPLWGREALARRLSISRPLDDDLTATLRRLLLGTMLVPVLVLTAWVAAIGFGGASPSGPAGGSFFAQLGRLASDLVPLVLLIGTLVGHGRRERLPGYIGGAGLLAVVTVMGGFALHIVQTTGTLGDTAALRMVQLGGLTAAVWALGWLLARRSWEGGAEADQARQLVSLHVGLAFVISAGLLFIAALTLVGGGTDLWHREAGSPLGGVALLLTGAAVAVAAWRTGLTRDAVHLAGLGALAVVAFVACSEDRFVPGTGERVLLLGTAALALGWALAPSFLPWLRTTSLIWVAITGVIVLLVGLEAAAGDHHHLSASLAIALASLAGGIASVRERREEGLLVSGLGVNVAASLLVWHIHLVVPFTDWGVTLLQTNIIASALVGLLWLWWRQREMERPASSLLLSVQLGLTTIFCGLMTIPPLGVMFLDPDGPLPLNLDQVGNAGGWLALLLTAGAALWHVGRVAPRALLDVGGPAATAAGILLACTVSPWNTPTNWLTFHTLLAAESAVPLSIGALALVAVASRQPLQASRARAWALAAGLLVVLLAIRGDIADRQSPLPAALATLSVAGAAAALVVAYRRRLDLAASAVLVNLAALFLWEKWGRETLEGFLEVQALGLGLSAAVWTVIDVTLRRTGSPLDLRGTVAPFRWVSVVVVLALLGTVTALDLTYGGKVGPAAWGALAAAVVTLAGAATEGEKRLAAGGLYVAGLLAVGMALPLLAPVPADRVWVACLLLAGHVLVAAVVARAVAAVETYWFLPVQALVALVVLALSGWVSIEWATVAERLAGPGAVAGLTAAALLMTRRLTEPTLEGWWSPRFATLALGTVLLAELGWALVGDAVSAPALHRNVILLSALSVATAVYGLLLARLGTFLPAWADAGRRSGPVFGVLAFVALLVVIGQELALFRPALKQTPMHPAGVTVVIVVLLWLMAAQIRFAVVPGRDPFGLSDRRRTLYVYLAELLLAGLFVHVRLNLPWLFSGRLMQYWTFLIMALAFVGAGLAELFRRRGLTVLAQPIFRTAMVLPVVPLVAFWLRPPEALHTYLREKLPGTDPLLTALERLPNYHSVPSQFDRYALLWFLLGAIYAGLALVRQSSRGALAAALAANVGFWCLLYHHQWWFGLHPQLWLVPLALIVLVTEHLNRHRLEPAQASGMRYAGLGLLYLSSTADMFITGLGQSVVLPLVLTLFSLAGVFTGILLRVRAYLFLGVGFLALVIFSMIWHAAVDLAQVWVWWASGVVLGLIILGVFALFEKRRNDVLRVVEEVRAWK